LAGIKPYDRAARALTLPQISARPAMRRLEEVLPAVHKVLAVIRRRRCGLKENFFWVNNKIDDLPTFAVTHLLLPHRETHES